MKEVRFKNSKEEVEESVLKKLQKDKVELLLENFDIVEIRLKPDSYIKLRQECGRFSSTEVQGKEMVLGIPVIVDSSIPSDRAYLVARKRREK